MLSRKLTFIGIFPESTALFTEVTGTESNTMAYDTKKLLLNDPVIFYDNSYQNLERDF